MEKGGRYTLIVVFGRYGAGRDGVNAGTPELDKPEKIEWISKNLPKRKERAGDSICVKISIQSAAENNL